MKIDTSHILNKAMDGSCPFGKLIEIKFEFFLVCGD